MYKSIATTVFNPYSAALSVAQTNEANDVFKLALLVTMTSPSQPYASSEL